MTNEYGEALDRNGYAETILPSSGCYICARTNLPLQRHEIFHGPYRKKSKAYGCWVNLCYECHAEVHHSNLLSLRLKRIAQQRAMNKYSLTVSDFRKIFGKNFKED